MTAQSTLAAPTPDALSSEPTIAAYAVALVTALGCDTVFSLTGGMAMHLNRAVATQAGLRAIYCQHEQAAVAAAEGYACASDYRRAGFAVVTSGPGVSNTVTSLLSAFANSAPLILLAGQIKSEDIDPFGVRTHGLQEIPSQALLAPCVKRFARLTREGFRTELVATLSEAFAGRPGPVAIEVPLDVQGAPAAAPPGALEEDVAAIRAEVTAAVEAEEAAARIGPALERLVSGRRPLLYVGNGCRIAGVEAWVRRLIEETGLPAVFSWPAADILPAAHPLNFGCPGGLAPVSANRVLGRADQILFLGARLDLATTAFQRADFGGQAARTFVDVDEAELAKFAGLTNATTVQMDLRGLIGLPLPGPGRVDAAWIDWCAGERTAALATEGDRFSGEDLTVRNLARRLSAWAGGRVVVPASSGYATETFIRFFEPPAEATRSFTSAGLGAMGFGLPMGLGAAFGSERRVACVDADGGLMLNVQELATLKRYAPPGFLLFIMNNDGYASIRMSQERHFGSAFGADGPSGVSLPGFDLLCAAFDLPYHRLDSLPALDGFLQAYDSDAPPQVIDVILARSEPRGPAVKTVIGPDGRPTSTPLSDIDW